MEQAAGDRHWKGEARTGRRQAVERHQMRGTLVVHSYRALYAVQTILIRLFL